MPHPDKVLKSDDIYELSDFCYSLKEMQKIIDELILKYSEDALIYCDAGYNNVSVYVSTKLRQGKKK